MTAIYKVLMIGNSYTFYNELPLLLEATAKVHLPDLAIMASLKGGKDWQWHWEEGEARSLLENHGWDCVILQNHSRATQDFYETMRTYGKQMQEAARGARLILYMTWARAHEPEAISTIAKGYQNLAEELHAEVAPVGLVWREVQALTEPPVLHTEDQSHPTPIGSYLALCTLYAVLTKQSATTLPGALPDHTEPILGVPSALAKEYQGITDSVIAGMPDRALREYGIPRSDAEYPGTGKRAPTTRQRRIF